MYTQVLEEHEESTIGGIVDCAKIDGAKYNTRRTAFMDIL